MDPSVLSSARAAVIEAAPLVQCLTNTVVQTFTANALLAVGASPAMADNQHEAGDFARIASAVLVNLGTPNDDTAQAMLAAAQVAHQNATPWVLDPVAVGALAWRTGLAADLLELRPDVVRGNASEVVALAGAGAGGRGTDSTISSDDAAEVATDLARRTGGVVAVSGEIDLITDGSSTVRVAGGHPYLTRTTGAGCALGALTAAYIGATDSTLAGAVAAHAHVALAAERAATVCTGPGSFAIAWLDALDAIGPAELAAADLR